MSQTFVAKHAFAGQAAQAQLTFPKGAVLIAKPGQEGSAWWWGSCNGREGWFPPAYVTAQQATGFPTAANPVNMQQRMQQTSFPSSIQQQQQRTQQPLPAYGQQPNAFAPVQQQKFRQSTNQGNPSFAGSFAGPAPVVSGGFGAPPASGFSVGADDPFAGLDAAPSPLPAMQSAQPTFSQPPSQHAAPAVAPAPRSITPQQAAPAVRSVTPQRAVRSVTPQRAAPGQAKPASAADNNDTAAAMTRLGVTTQQTSRPAAVPKPASHPAAVAPPKPQPATQPAKKPQPATQPVKKPQPAYPIPTSGATAHPPVTTQEEREAKRLREQEEAKLKAQIRKEKEDLVKEAAASTYAGIGSSGVTITAGGGDGVAISSVHMQSASFNPFDFLAGSDGTFPNRTFSPIFRVPPFWALMQLESYVRRYPIPKEGRADVAGMYAQLSKALSFICHVVVETDGIARSGRGRFGLGKRANTGSSDGPLSFLRMNHWACEACIKLISILPHSAGASGKQLDGLFLNFLNVYVSLIENLQANQQLVLPGGWQVSSFNHTSCQHNVSWFRFLTHPFN